MSPSHYARIHTPIKYWCCYCYGVCFVVQSGGLGNSPSLYHQESQSSHIRQDQNEISNKYWMHKRTTIQWKMVMASTIASITQLPLHNLYHGLTYTYTLLQQWLLQYTVIVWTTPQATPEPLYNLVRQPQSTVLYCTVLMYYQKQLYRSPQLSPPRKESILRSHIVIVIIIVQWMIVPDCTLRHLHFCQRLYMWSIIPSLLYRHTTV